MKKQLKRALAVLTVLACLLIAPAISQQAHAVATRQSLGLVGGNTDASHPVGSHDPYTETSTDGGLTWGPAYLVGNGHPWGVVSGTNSWINCGPSLTDCLLATSLYRYRFWVPADFTDPQLNGSMIMDNYGSVSLNGSSLVSNAPGNYTFPANTDLTGKLVAGWNELRVVLVDVGGLTGINFNLQVSVITEGTMRLASPGVLVVYDGQGATPSRLNESVTNGGSIATLPTASVDGYTLQGWFTAPTGGTKILEPYTPTVDTTLYAHWALTDYQVTYDERGGSAVPDSTYQMGGTVTLAGPSTQTGYTFDGWFDAPTGGNQYGASFTPSPLGDIVIYAHWTSTAPSSSPTPTHRPHPSPSQTSSSPSPSAMPTETPTPTATPSPTVTAHPSPTPSASTTKPATSRHLISKLITTFVGDKFFLKSSMKLELDALAKKIAHSPEFRCIGSTSGTSVTAFDKQLATDRANTVCNYLSKKLGGTKFSISINPSSANRPAARHVWVYAKYSD